MYAFDSWTHSKSKLFVVVFREHVHDVFIANVLNNWNEEKTLKKLGRKRISSIFMYISSNPIITRIIC